MSNKLEILVTSDSNNTLWTSCLWDPYTGTNLMTYRGGGTAESRTLSFIGEDYISCVEKTKPVLHIWPLNSSQTVQGMRFVLPGKASALAFTRDGAYCAAGIDEKIYIWQIASGKLLIIINRHFQKVTIIKFTADGRYFVSSAEDGVVMVWSLASVTVNPEIDLVTQATAGQSDPVHIFTDHSLPVTDLYLSKLGIQGRLLTVSSDRTCKIYNLPSGEMLLNVVFDLPLTSVTMDVLELNLFVGTVDGNIYQCSLINPPRSRDLIVNSDNTICPVFTSHTRAVTCLSTSIDGESLVSGSNDEQVILWHIQSQQPIRTMRHKGAITNAFFATNNPVIYKQDFLPSMVLHSLDRVLERDSSDPVEIEVLIKKPINFWPKIDNAENGIDISKTIESENEFTQKELSMREEIDKLKKINADLYAFSVQKVLTSTMDNKNTSPINNRKKRNKKKF